jgi:hypothetical protein
VPTFAPADDTIFAKRLYETGVFTLSAIFLINKRNAKAFSMLCRVAMSPRNIY